MQKVENCDKSKTNHLQELKELVMLRIDNVEKLSYERFQSQEKALNLHSIEILRRLDLLNGEAERLRNIQATYLPREVWENIHKEQSLKIEELKSYKDNLTGRYSIISIVISTLIGLSFLILNYLIKLK